MAVGTVSISILTDIANAIRYQAGVATTYKPREMAAAVAALDGTDAGNYQAQPYMALESGVLPESVFSDIADAIRGQNGLSTLYQPGDMAAAILALEWDVGYKIRALLLDDGTLEINYYKRRTSVTGGRIVQVFEIDPAGYSSASARSYDSIKLLVKKVYIDSTIAILDIKNCNYWFNAFSNCTEVRGFENLSGMTSANQMFTSCGSLETIYATSFSNSGLSGSLMFNSCNRLVGGTDGFVPSTTSGASVCKLGAGGVLTDPNDDRARGSGRTSTRTARACSPHRPCQTQRASSWHRTGSAPSASTWGSASRPGTASPVRRTVSISRARRSLRTWRASRT